MDDRTPLLSDFGLSCSNTDPPKGERVGTPTHMSPEVIRGDPYGEEVDVYALGVVHTRSIAQLTRSQDHLGDARGLPCVP